MGLGNFTHDKNRGKRSTLITPYLSNYFDGFQCVTHSPPRSVSGPGGVSLRVSRGEGESVSRTLTTSRYN